MYLCQDSDIAISITPMDPVLKVWDLTTKTQVKEYRIEGLSFFASLLLYCILLERVTNLMR